MLTRKAIEGELRANPMLVDEWEVYSDNQRCDGWVFRAEDGQYAVFRASTEGAIEVDTNTWRGGRYMVHERLTFNDRTEACAEYVVREVQSLAKFAKKSD
jgi:hypothetical protein